MTRYLVAQYAFAEGNHQIAARILRAGAKQAHAQSRCMFGLLHELGAGVTKDLKPAVDNSTPSRITHATALPNPVSMKVTHES